MRVIVCGGRSYARPDRLCEILDTYKITGIAHGGAPGVDTLADIYAHNHGIPVVVFKAQWLTLGRYAGPVRNNEMLREYRPKLVIAFPGGRGTANMIKLAHKAKVRVDRVE
jgi:hypothetical protein